MGYCVEKWVPFIYKYKPKSIKEYLHEDIKQIVESRFSSNYNLPRLIVISGGTGYGKTTLARILCQKYISNIDMEKLASGEDINGVAEVSVSATNLTNLSRILNKSIEIKENEHPNIVILDDFNIGYEADQRLVMDSLLKNSTNIIIMCVNDYTYLNNSLKTRCDLHLHINRLSEDDMTNHLKSICDSEGVKISREAIKLIVRKGRLNIRECVNYLQHTLDSLQSYEITKEMVESLEVLEQLSV